MQKKWKEWNEMKKCIWPYVFNICQCFKQEPVEPGDSPKIGFGHRKVYLVSELCPGQSSKCKQFQTWAKQSYSFFALPIYPLRYTNLQSFLFISLIVSELCPGQNSKFKYEQRAITPKIGKAELWCTIHFPNEIYLPTKYLIHF
jgi:hypothetical protein